MKKFILIISFVSFLGPVTAFSAEIDGKPGIGSWECQGRADVLVNKGSQSTAQANTKREASNANKSGQI